MNPPSQHDYSQAILDLDREALAACQPGEPLAVGAWVALFEGRAADTQALAEKLLEQASRAGHAAQVVEATALRALAAASAGQQEAATELARRACRMAQAEASLPLELLASLVLARVRRLAGRPHLALRILGSVARAAPPSWRPWITWEVLLAGGLPRGLLDEAPEDPPAAMRAAEALESMLAAVAGGDRSAFERSAAVVTAAVARFADLARDLHACRATLDTTFPGDSPSIDSWLTGTEISIPAGLHGLGTPANELVDAEVALAFVLASPGKPGRRLLRSGLGLLAGVHNLEDDRAPARGLSRTDSGLATLALAAPGGLERGAFFERLYGFRFQQDLHRGALDVLVHRMRARIGTAGDIERDRDTAVLRLTLQAPIAIPDPRCALPLGERVLRALASLGGANAQETAEAMRMPLRTVQTALQQLVADGSCSLERDGRRVAYRVQDTTFTDPAAARVPER